MTNTITSMMTAASQFGETNLARAMGFKSGRSYTDFAKSFFSPKAANELLAAIKQVFSGNAFGKTAEVVKAAHAEMVTKANTLPLVVTDGVITDHVGLGKPVLLLKNEAEADIQARLAKKPATSTLRTTAAVVGGLSLFATGLGLALAPKETKEVLESAVKSAIETGSMLVREAANLAK